MSVIIRLLSDNLEQLKRSQDFETAKLPLVDSVWYPAAIIGFYLLLVCYGLPAFMENRKAYNIRKAIIAYNAIQIVVCSYIGIEGVRYLVPQLDWRCAMVDTTVNSFTKYSGFIFWCYYMLKISDLMDTVFFALKRNQRQITFLHVYHHGGMVLLGWVMTRYFSNGHCTYIITINSFVHVAMYSYYLLSAYNPIYKTNIALKKTITHMQLMQFLAGTFIWGQLLVRDNCHFPSLFVIFIYSQNFFMAYLFLDFYYKAYIKQTTVLTSKVVKCM